ncbi:glycosyltransferase [Rhodocytophaga aerolata]|uniref:Glycosyltransferase n=1 Tax=Rhodocytophaga aerolata TaxID=455078 RepID=A0ABT8R6S4_9BACT|nr:glycosyltransferase [Rhodocytophaga aerolata]MDO1447797.1 glycosyltransferase [Rhodocytophaga aerolata]
MNIYTVFIHIILYSFIASVAVQLLYWASIFSRLAFYKQAPAAPSDSLKKPGVSVIVCGWNELENLKKLIPRLLEQNYPVFELIIVDDRSNDECYDFLLFESFKHAQMRLVRINETPDHITPKKYALSLGIKAAQYDIILLTDADCMPQSIDWISQMQQKFSAEKQVILGYSPYVYHKGLLNFMIRYETFYTAAQYFSFTLAGLPYMGVGRNLAYTKSLFISNKGFHSHLNVLGGDDDLFVSEVATPKNVAICIEKQAHVVSVPKTTFLSWYRQKRRHLSVGKHYTFRNKVMLGLMSLSQMMFWFTFFILLFSNEYIPWVLAGFLIRTSTQLWMLQNIAKKIDTTIKWFFIPIFDLLYTIYYIIIGSSVSISKQVRWN